MISICQFYNKYLSYQPSGYCFSTGLVQMSFAQQVSGDQEMPRWILYMVLALVLMAAACGSNDDDESGIDAPQVTAEEAEREAPAPRDAEPDEAETEAESEAAEPEDAESEPAESEPAEPEDGQPEEPEPGPVVLTASFRGVSETEIKIGIGLVDVSAFGIDAGDPEAQWQAVFDRVNDAGGVNGRLLAPVYAIYSPVDDAAIEAACVQLVEDEEVFAFVGFVLGDGVLCYTELYGMLAVNTWETAPDVIGRSGGLLFTTQGSVTGRIASLINAADADGLIDGQKIQIHLTADDESLLEPMQELIEAAGGIVTRAMIGTAPPGDLPAAEAETNIWIERAEADGVDAILAYNTTGFGAVGGVERAGSDLAVITDSISRAGYIDLGYDPSQVNLYAYGVPTLHDHYNAGTAGVPECVENYESRSGNVVNVGTDPSPTNFSPTIRACRGLELFVAIATAAGPVLTQDSFIEAARGLGSFDLTATTSASLGEGKYSADNAPLVRLFWDPEVADFVSGN